MDVLRPPIIRIGNRCYRKNPTLHSNTNTAEEDEYEGTAYVHDSGWNDEVCDINTNVENTGSGFRISMDVPSDYFKFIIGKKGETKKRLEMETKTQINIPKQGKEGDIVILGPDRKGVVSAKSRLEILIDSARQRLPFTHFLSYPVCSEGIKQQFADFKSDVLRECDGASGLDETIFQKPPKLHLTIGTLVLLSDSEINRAVDILKLCKEELIQPILKGRPLQCHLRGLEYMNDDPREVDVLYAKVHMESEDDMERLQILSDRLVDKFTSSGLMQSGFDHVKLHATVMNTLMRKDASGTSLPWRSDGRGPVDRESFDASDIMKKFGNYDFGPLCINTIHMSQRHQTGPDGYYACSGSVTLP